MVVEIVLATRNLEKAKEVKKILRRLQAKILSLADFPNVPETKETGKTLHENAVLKAVAAANKTNMIAVAEDTGLFIQALGGFPGVFTARFAGEGASDAERRRRVLELMRGNKNRRAAFLTVVAIAKPGETVKEARVVEGKCFGKITEHPKGRTGFGFDPVFVPQGYRKTFAQLGLKTKNRISHRAEAFKKAEKVLERILMLNIQCQASARRQAR